jgi:hypothetical protein
METIISSTSIRVPWNKGKLVGQKAPFKLKEIWGIRAEFSTLPTSLLGNTPESSILGFNFWGWIQPAMARTRYAGRRRR